ncbi:hypothetical protein [Marispirochaeta aestuarii]|uniref:hypothetical protein n=1 Tax=Marispirochaeta aestuarii TaxID=1963862 RepID=UPI002ABE2E8C|nr:hypothetical protein [Marispirochaeta aestuarii]
MNYDELKEEIDFIKNPPHEEINILPDTRISKIHKLDTSYYRIDYAAEGLSTHADTRICRPNEKSLQKVLKNLDVPRELFFSAFHLILDSFLEYKESKKEIHTMKYYPSIILTFWSGFETLIRFLSELYVSTAIDVPLEVKDYLLETEGKIKPDLTIKTVNKYNPVLDRYAVLLKYAYNFDRDKGSKQWQNIIKAKYLRDYFSHLKVDEPKSVSCSEVLIYMENILLSIIYPCCEIKKTIFLGIYEIYNVWNEIYKLSQSLIDHIEEPFHKSFPDAHIQFWCNFENVDNKRFPNSQEHLRELGIEE